MNSGAGYFLLGIFLDAISLLLRYLKVNEYITVSLGFISIILIFYGIYRINKYDKIIEKGRIAREEKKKSKK